MTEAKGVNGTLLLDGDKLIIQRKGALAFMTQGLKGDKTIYLNQISSIQLKRAGLLTNGYVQFAFLGGLESKGGLFNATKDENTVMFNAKQQKAFDDIKAEIEKFLSKERQQARENKSSDLDDLERLAALKDKGIVSPEEFEAKKKQILGL